jgi:hypothetical protein
MRRNRPGLVISALSMLLVGLILSPVALGGLSASAMPGASESVPRVVRADHFKGRVNAPALAHLRQGALGTHTITVIPMYYARVPNAAVIKKMATQVTAFWAREIPGVRLTFHYKAPRKVSQALACYYGLALPYLQRTGGVNPFKSHVHVLGWAPECYPEGYAWVAKGNGVMWVAGTIPQVMAHEFGHNLGLLHSNGLACIDSAKHPTALSGNCIESEYEDPFSVMGNSCEVAMKSCRVPGPDIAEFIGKATTVTKGQDRTVTLVGAGLSGVRTAIVRTSLGVLYFDQAPTGVFRNEPRVPPGVQVRVLTQRGNAVLNVPDIAGSLNVRPDTQMEFLDSWVIPGLNLRALVVSASERKSSIRFMPVSSKDVAPAAPLITSPIRTPAGLPYLLTWAQGASTNVLGYVISRTEDFGTTIYRLPASATSLTLPAVNSGAGAVVRMWAVSKAGLKSKQSAIKLTNNLNFVDLSLDSQAMSPNNVDALHPQFDVYVGATGTFKWTVAADSVAQVTGWLVHVTLRDGTTLDIPLSAGTRNWVLPAAVLQSIGDPSQLLAPNVIVQLSAQGTAYQASITLWPAD